MMNVRKLEASEIIQSWGSPIHEDSMEREVSKGFVTDKMQEVDGSPDGFTLCGMEGDIGQERGRR